MSHSIHEQHTPTAILCAVFAALSFAYMGAVVQVIGLRASEATLIFFRFWVGFLLMLPWVLKNPKEIFFISQPLKILGRGFFTLVAVWSSVYALRKISLSDMLVLNSTYTLFIPLIIWAVYKIKMAHKMWIGIGIGFLGVIIILKPDPATFNIGSVYGFVSGISTAAAFVMIRFISKTTTAVQIMFYNFLIGIVVTAALLPFGWINFNKEVFFLLLIVGILSGAYQSLVTLAFSKGSVRSISPLLYLSIPFGVITDYFLWHLIPGEWAIFGVVCVIVGGILTIFFGKKC